MQTINLVGKKASLVDNEYYNVVDVGWFTPILFTT